MLTTRAYVAQAGVHSGDSACSIPPQTISADALATIREWTPRLAKALKVIGLINIQYVVQDNQARCRASPLTITAVRAVYAACSSCNVVTSTATPVPGPQEDLQQHSASLWLSRI